MRRLVPCSASLGSLGLQWGFKSSGSQQLLPLVCLVALPKMAFVPSGGYDLGMDNTPVLPPGQAFELEQFVREKTLGNHVFLNALLPLIPAAHAEAVRRGDAELSYGLLRQASDVLWDMMYALAPLSRLKDPYHGRLWRHSDRFPDPWKGGPCWMDRWAPDQDEVEAAAAAYLEHPWMSSGYLEWSLVDALARREILAYEEHVALKLPKPWTSAWVAQKAITIWIPWLIVAVVLVASAGWLWFEFSSEAAPYRWWWAAGIGAYWAWFMLSILISVPTRIRSAFAKRKEILTVAERLQTMYRCYDELNGPVLDPTRIRDLMLAAERLEIRWSRATWPLLEAAIARHPHLWKTGC